jgi:signal transduction histidine kinase
MKGDGSDHYQVSQAGNKPARSTEKKPGIPVARPKILIADDDPAIIDLLERKLTAAGYECESARDGDEVLSKAGTCRPDLILLDVMMPKRDGYQVLQMLRAGKRTKDVPVIMVTGKVEIPDKVKGLHLGAGDYLTKPFSTDELIARVNVHLKGKRGVEEKIKAEKLVALSTMIDGLAHEVRNPLAVIGGFANILLKKTEPEDPRYPYIAAISLEVSRLEKMLNDIYSLKTMTINRSTRSSVNGLVRKVLQSLTGKLSAQNISLSLELEPKPMRLLLDPACFKTGLSNIVQNAIDAMPQGGKLTVITQRGPEYFRIHVIDTGLGMKEDHLRFIFDPFFTSKMKGAGLGLTLALKVFQGHGGAISVNSTPGAGTEFVIECPLGRTNSEKNGS